MSHNKHENIIIISIIITNEVNVNSFSSLLYFFIITNMIRKGY